MDLTGTTRHLKNYWPEYQHVGDWNKQKEIQIRVIQATQHNPNRYFCQLVLPGAYISNAFFNDSDLI